MIPAVIIESIVTNAASPTIHPASIQLEPLMKAIFGSLLVLHCFCSNSHTGQILWRTWC